MITWSSSHQRIGVLSVLILALISSAWVAASYYTDSALLALPHSLRPQQSTNISTSINEIASANESAIVDEFPSTNEIEAVSPKTSRLHLFIPATSVAAPLCAVVASTLVNRYPPPMIIGYKAKGEFDASQAHIAKLRVIDRYLDDQASDLADDDLVLVVDGFDVVAQVPAGIMIERYFDVTARADKQLADKHGLTIKEARAHGLRQTILFGTDKGCFMRMVDPECWLLPESSLPRYIWGPNWNNGDLAFTDSKFLNSGTVMGPVGDLRKLVKATLRHIKEVWNPEEHFKNSDQSYLAQMYARQEYHRTLDINKDFYSGDVDRHLPKKKTGPDDVTEYHIFVDYDMTFTQTQCNNDRFIHKLKYNNKDNSATVRTDFLEEGDRFQPYRIQMPNNLRLAFMRLLGATLVNGTMPAKPLHEWVRSLQFGTNVATHIIWGFYHNTCNKDHFMDRYRESWFYPYLRPLLRAAARAITNEEPIHPDPIDGRIWKVARPYPTIQTPTDFGGVFTDHGPEPFIPLQDFCARHVDKAFGGKLEMKQELVEHSTAN